jgi:hypothetical protein
LAANSNPRFRTSPCNPLIPLGTLGQLQGTQWQVVGFQHRMGVAPGDDEHFGWSEYLLYNQKRGFCFLVDSEEGWSLVRPTTGAPSMASSKRRSATYLGTTYTLKYSYEAETNYVCGEFYWQVARAENQNKDFANGKRLLSLEQSASEWCGPAATSSASDTVAKAFKLEGQERPAQARRGAFQRRAQCWHWHHHRGAGCRPDSAESLLSKLLQLRPQGGELFFVVQLRAVRAVRLVDSRAAEVTSSAHGRQHSFE